MPAPGRFVEALRPSIIRTWPAARRVSYICPIPIRRPD